MKEAGEDSLAESQTAQQTSNFVRGDRSRCRGTAQASQALRACLLELCEEEIYCIQKREAIVAQCAWRL